MSSVDLLDESTVLKQGRTTSCRVKEHKLVTAQEIKISTQAGRGSWRKQILLRTPYMMPLQSEPYHTSACSTLA